MTHCAVQVWTCTHASRACACCVLNEGAPPQFPTLQLSRLRPGSRGCGRAPPPSCPIMEALRQIFEGIWPESGGEPPARDLGYVELVGGNAAVSGDLPRLGRVGRTLDQRYLRELHDAFTPRGFGQLACHVARLRPGGLLWVLPPVSDSPENVLHLQRLIVLSAFARSRGVAFLWEQPESWHVYGLPDLQEFHHACPELLAQKTHDGTLLWGTPSYLRHLALLGYTGFGAEYAWAYLQWFGSVYNEAPEPLPHPRTALLSSHAPLCFRAVEADLVADGLHPSCRARSRSP